MPTAWATAAVAALSLVAGCNSQIPTARCLSGQYTLIDASKRPSTRNCQSKGYLVSPSPLGNPVAAGNLAACVQTCKSTSGCVSFGYSAANSTACVLYNKRLIDMGYLKRMTDLGTVFSNQLCYSCTPLACPNTDAVRNGDFEDAADDDDSRPEGWHLTPSQQTDDQLLHRVGSHANTGSYAVETFYTRTTGANSDIVQQLPCVNPGLEYELTAYYAGNTVAEFSMLLDDQVVFGPTQGGLGYVPATVTVKANNTTPTLTLRFTQAHGTGPADVDTVSMTLKVPS